MEEVWKSLDFLGCPNYEVSSLGRVRNMKTNCVRVLGGNGHGYLKVRLRNGTPKGQLYQVHRLVALAFIPNPENKPEVGHKNTVRDDNRVENLEWVTRKENNNHPITQERRSKASKEFMNSDRNPHRGKPATTKGRIWIHKDDKNKMVLPENAQPYFDSGWSKGHTRFVF